MVTGMYITIITLNVNGLSAPTKRYKLTEWTQKQDLYICSLQENHFRPSDTYRLKVGMEEDIPWKLKENWSSNSHIRQNRL